MTAKKSPAKKPTASFEEQLDALEKIVASLEQGDLPLEQSLKAYEEGIKLTRLCQTALQQAEQRVAVVSQDNGQIIVDTIEGDDEDKA